MGCRDEPLDPYDSVPLLLRVWPIKPDSGLFDDTVVPDGSILDYLLNCFVLGCGRFSSSVTS